MMKNNRPYVLTIAGFDPSGGAGVLADVKTFEQHKVNGLAVCSAITLQTEHEFVSLQWTELNELLSHVEKLLDTYPVKVVKTGIVPSFAYLNSILDLVKNKNEKIKVIADPVIRSSTEFDFISFGEKEKINLAKVFLLTPNAGEAVFLSGTANIHEAAKNLSAHCNVLLKGGHNTEETGTDFLYLKNEVIKFHPSAEAIYEKHGSGCVLSSAIAANLALGDDLVTACNKAKKYTENFLSSNTTLLGHHA